MGSHFHIFKRKTTTFSVFILADLTETPIGVKKKKNKKKQTYPVSTLQKYWGHKLQKKKKDWVTVLTILTVTKGKLNAMWEPGSNPGRNRNKDTGRIGEIWMSVF